MHLLLMFILVRQTPYRQTLTVMLFDIQKKLMRNYLLLIILTSHISCNPGSGTNTCDSNIKEQIDKIDEAISEKDTYQNMGHLRYPANAFRADSLPLLDSNFVHSFVTVYHDTLTRRIIRIDFTLGKERLSTAARSDHFYYDDNNKLIKIQILTHDTDPQYSASYYFQNNNLICKRTKNIEIKDIDSYLLKTDTVYQKVSSVLLKKGIIE
jgi:hypothetical protein